MGRSIVEYITYGGISIINAIPAWLGGTAAINLLSRVRVTEGTCSVDGFMSFILNYLRDKWGLDANVCVSVDSSIPESSGLKSNSAVAVGIVHAVMDFLGRPISPLESARLASIITKAHGSSITGAFDDASASILGGVVFTDNKSMTIIKHRAVDELRVIITGYRESKRLSRINRLRALSGVYSALFEMAVNGDLWRAATINGMLVAEALGYHRALETISNALRLGALASAVSGNGPSIYAVFKAGEEGPFVDYVVSSWGYYLTTSLVGPRYSV